MELLEKKLNKIPKFYRGELFDLTVTSANNIFGKEKINHSLDNGINFKIDYFIKELDKMTSIKQDDKSEKRKIRKKFLELCNSSVLLKYLFDLLINYLNGGQSLNMKNEYNNQSLIVVLMGGNIINIYFNIIYYSKKKENIEFIYKIFDNIPNLSIIIRGILNNLNEWLNLEENIKFLNFIDNERKFFSNYSDLDFALLPNNIDLMEINGGGSREKRERKAPSRFDPSIVSPSKPKVKPKVKSKVDSKVDSKVNSKVDSKVKKTIKKREENIYKEKNIEDLYSTNGFLLYRIKTNFSILDDNVESGQEINFFKDIKKENDKINETYTSKQYDCTTSDISKLGILFRSELIAQLAQKDWMTKEYISEKCKFFIENLLAKKERTRLCTNKNTEIICNNHGLNDAKDLEKLKNIIIYIRIITTRINTNLTNVKIINNVYEIFDNLYSILNPKNNLISICNYIVNDFYNLKETQDVIDNINNFYKQVEAKSNNFNINTFNINKYPSILNKINELTTILPSKVKSGIILTINLIFGNKNDKIIYNDYEYENKYFDDLEKEFIYDGKKENLKLVNMETDKILRDASKMEMEMEIAKGKNKKNRALSRKCKNKKYRKKHTKKCKKILKKLREAKK